MVSNGYFIVFSNSTPSAFSQTRQSFPKDSQICRLPWTICHPRKCLVTLKDIFYVIYSNLFPIPKSSGGIIPILKIPEKQVPTYSKVSHEISKVSDWLSDTSKISCISRHSRYLPANSHLPISVGDKLFQLVTLPSPLTLAPRVFTRVLAPLLTFLPWQPLLKDPSPLKLSENAEITIHIL